MRKPDILNRIRISFLILIFISFGVIIIQIKTREIIDSRIVVATMIFLLTIFIIAKYLLRNDPKAENE